MFGPYPALVISILPKRNPEAATGVIIGGAMKNFTN
jgi:hypothetical protein